MTYKEILKKITPTGLRSQLILSIAIVQVVLMSLFVTELMRRQEAFFLKLNHDRAMGLSISLASTSNSSVISNDLVRLQKLVSTYKEIPGLQYAVVTADDGTVLAHTDEKYLGLKTADTISGRLKSANTTQILLENDHVLDIASPIISHNEIVGWARIGLSQEYIEPSLAEIRRKGLLYILLSLIIGSIFGVVVAAGLSKGLQNLVTAAKKIRAGSRDVRVGPARSFEISQLGTAFNQMLDELALNESALRDSFESSAIGMAIVTMDGKFKKVNPELCRMLGYSEQELLSLTFKDISHGETLDSDFAFIESVRKNQADRYKTEKKYYHKNGTVVWANLNSSAIKDEGGMPLHFITQIEDITERKKSEERIKEREAQLTAFFENIEGAASLLDAEKKYVLFNNRFILDNHLLTDNSPCIGDEVYAGFPDAVRNERLKILDNVLQGNREVIEAEYLRDGKRVYYRTTFSPVITDEKVTGISTYSLNLTKSKEAEEKIRQSEIKYRNIFENVMDVVFQTTLDGTILEVSPSAETLVGLTREQLIGTRVELLYYDQADREKGESLPAALRENNGEVKDFELRFKSATCEPIYISVNARLIRNAGGSAMHIDGMFRNITESKKAEGEIKKLNRLYHFVSRINESMLKLDSREEILAEACNIAVEVGKCQMAWIGAYDELNDKIVPTTWSGFEDEFFESIGNSSFKVSTSSIPSARAIRTQSHFYYNDIEHDASIPDAIKKEMLKRNYRSGISLPIFIDSKIVAAFVMLMSEPFFFTEEEVKLVKDVTDNITYALDKIEIRDLRKKAEENLRHSEEKHRALTENISDAIMLLDENLENIYQSPSVEKIVGHRINDGSSKRALDFVHPDDFQIARDFFKKSMHTPAEPIRSQFRIRHKEGHYIWVEGTVTNLLKNENVKAFIVNYRDVTERINAEAVIKYQAETFSAIIENANESIWLLSPDMKVLQYNKTGRDRLRFNRGKDIYPGANFKDFLHIGTENVFMPMFNEALAGKYPELESCQTDVNGEDFWLRTRMYPVYDAQKRLIGITVLAENITIRKKVEKELEQSEEKHRSLIENIGDAIYLINEKAEIIYRSPSADRVSSYTDGEMAGKKIFDFVHPDDLGMENDVFNRSNELPGVSVPFELRSRHKEGHYIWLEGSIINLQQTPGINGFVLNYRDITDRKKAEAEIAVLNESLEQKVIDRTAELLEANKALEAFSYSVSHDLRAPVRTVIGFTKIIKSEYGAGFTKEVNELFDHIEGSSKRMNTIIDDLLTLAKYEKVKLQPVAVDMEKLIKKVWTEILFHTPHNATLQIGTLPEALADTSLIEQVVVNLISNAVKYSSKKDKPIVSVGFEIKDGTITYSVKDNGAGFDMKNYDRLFGAFQRLHGMSEFEGTGVGLLLVKRIVEKHGGVVWAESKVDEGATFYFTLPSPNAN